MRAAGASEAEIDQVVAERGEAPQPDQSQDDAFAVEPANWASWQVFEMVNTQWVWAPMGMAGAARVALNHCAVESGLRMLGVPRREWPERYADLRLIEQAVLVADNDIRARHPKGKPNRPRG